MTSLGDITDAATGARTWLAQHGLWAGETLYNDAAKLWLKRSGHYLNAPPPGAFVAVRLAELERGLFDLVPAPGFLGLAVIGRPVARMLPQKGEWGELLRFVLAPELPKGTASRLLRVATLRFFVRPYARKLISYHDRTKHTGCIYKKAGFKKDGTTRTGGRRGSWDTRPGRDQGASSEAEPKRRWAIEIWGGS